MSIENKTTKTEKPMAYDTLLSAVLSPDNTKLFKETNPYHPNTIISNKEGGLPRNEFVVIIESWDSGKYRFVNSLNEVGKTSNKFFTPNNQKPLKTIGDLNALWKAIVGTNLTLIAQ